MRPLALRLRTPSSRSAGLAQLTDIVLSARRISPFCPAKTVHRHRLDASRIEFGKRRRPGTPECYSGGVRATIHIGRVGNLALALGVGAAVFTGWGCAVASADATGTSSPDRSSTHSDAGPGKRAHDSAGAADPSGSRDDKRVSDDAAGDEAGRAEAGSGTPRRSHRFRGADSDAAPVDGVSVDTGDEVDVVAGPDAGDAPTTRVGHTYRHAPEVTRPPVHRFLTRAGDQTKATADPEITHPATSSVGHTTLRPPPVTDPLRRRPWHRRCGR